MEYVIVVGQTSTGEQVPILVDANGGAQATVNE